VRPCQTDDHLWLRPGCGRVTEGNRTAREVHLLTRMVTRGGLPLSGRLIFVLFSRYSSLDRIARLHSTTTAPEVKSAAGYVEPRLFHFNKYMRGIME
jgi:hypothetical protein